MTKTAIHVDHIARIEGHGNVHVVIERMKKQIITLAVTGLLLSGCGIYTKYEPVTSIPDQLYGCLLYTSYTTVTACYWKNNHEQGIGYNRRSTEATKVDGTSVTWKNAVDAMNTALQNAGSEWRYELKGALPTLRKQ